MCLHVPAWCVVILRLGFLRGADSGHGNTRYTCYGSVHVHCFQVLHHCVIGKLGLQTLSRSCIVCIQATPALAWLGKTRARPQGALLVSACILRGSGLCGYALQCFIDGGHSFLLGCRDADKLHTASALSSPRAQHARAVHRGACRFFPWQEL